MIIVPRDEKESILDRLYRIRDKFNEEYKDTKDIELMIGVLEKDDESLLDKMTLEGCAYFFSIVDYKYYYDIFYGLLFEIFESDKDEIKKTYITSNLIPSNLLNDDNLLELILKQDDEILENFKYYKFDNTSLDVLYKILNRMNNLDCKFFKIQCDSKKGFISQNIDFSKKIIESENFIEDSKYIESIYLKKMFMNCTDLFEKFSIDEKIYLVDKIDNKNIQKELFDFFDLKRYPNRITKNLVSLLDKNTLLEKVYNNEYEYVSYLDSNLQIELLNNDNIDKESIAKYLNDDVIIYNLSINPEIIPIDVYLRVYNNGRNIKVEEYIKNLLLNIKSIDDDFILLNLIDSQIIKSFTDEQIGNLLSKIKKINNPLPFFDINKISKERFYDGIIKFILNKYDFKNSEYKIPLLLSELSIFPQEYREKILDNLDKVYLVYYSLYSDSEFRLLRELLDWNNSYLSEEEFNYIPKLELKSISYDKKYLILKEYLTDIQIENLFFINSKLIEKSKVIKSDFILFAQSNPKKIKNISLVKFLPKKIQVQILNNLSIDTFIESIPSDFSKHYDSSIIDLRYDEIVEYININKKDNYSLLGIYNLFNDDNKFKFISDISFKNAFYIYKNIITDKVDKKRVFRKIFSTKNILIDLDKSIVDSMNSEEIELFTSIAHFSNIVRAFIISNNDNLKLFIVDKIKSNYEILLEPSIYMQMDLLSILLDSDTTKYITDKVLKKLEKNELYNKFKDNSSLSLRSMLSILYGISKEYIDASNTDYLYKLYIDNNKFFDNLDSRLLRNDIFSLGDSFILKVIDYPDIVRKVYNIFNSEKANSLRNIILYLNNLSLQDNVYRNILNIILDYFNSDNKVIDNGKIMVEYILSSRLSLDKINSKLKLDSKYLDKKDKIIDSLLEETDSLEYLKELVYIKIYGVSNKYIKDIIDKYKTNYSVVEKYLKKSFTNIYISIQESIEELENIDELFKFINDVKTRYSVIDYYIFDDTMKSSYLKVITEEYNGINPTYENKTINIDNSIDVYKYTDSFGLITYTMNDNICSDYFIEWNRVSHVNNYISTSYISNSNLGLQLNGIVFGFKNISEHSIEEYAPYNLDIIDKAYFVTLSNLDIYTRMKSNSIKLNTSRSNINPNSLIIFEDMPYDIKLNTLKAKEDFLNHGIDLKIIYINRYECAVGEVLKIAHDIKEYLYSYDLDILESIITRYNTNISNIDYIGNIEKDELFITDSIKLLLDDTISHILAIDDEKLKYGEIVRFIEIIDNEKKKYDLINSNKFILYNNIKDKINDLKIELEKRQRRN